MPTRVTLCSVSQSASAARSALIVANLRLCTCQPPSGLGTRTQATSDAFAMSRPAARCTTVSIVMTLLLGRRLPGWPAGVGAESNRAFDSRARSNTPGHQPQLPRGSAKSLTKRLSCADAPVETWQSRAECRRIAGSEPPGRADLAGEESRDLAGSEPLSRLWARTRAADCHRRTSSPHS